MVSSIWQLSLKMECICWTGKSVTCVDNKKKTGFRKFSFYVCYTTRPQYSLFNGAKMVHVIVNWRKTIYLAPCSEVCKGETKAKTKHCIVIWRMFDYQACGTLNTHIHAHTRARANSISKENTIVKKNALMLYVVYRSMFCYHFNLPSFYEHVFVIAILPPNKGKTYFAHGSLPNYTEVPSTKDTLPCKLLTAVTSRFAT